MKVYALVKTTYSNDGDREDIVLMDEIYLNLKKAEIECSKKIRTLENPIWKVKELNIIE
jgi:hypothetical protein